MSRRSITLPIAWLLSCAPGVGAQSPQLPTGDTIRVERAVLISGIASAPGVLVDQRGDTIVMRTLGGDGETTWVLTRNSSVVARRGRERVGIRKGLLLGGVLGGVADLVVREMTRDCVRWTTWLGSHEDCSDSVPPGHIFLGGAVLGGLLGAIVKRDRWVEVGPGSVRFGFDFTPAGASALLRIRF